MSTVPAEQEFVLGPESAGLRMTPEEFDAVEEYHPEYRYELVDGVLVVTPIPLADETSPNDLLGYFLYDYRFNHPKGANLSDTLPQQYVYTQTGRRIADRLIWTSLGRLPDVRKDVPSIAVEFVSRGRHDRQRDYVDKRQEYGEAGIGEYWIFDRFQRTLTVIHYRRKKQKLQVVLENAIYESPFLPGFTVPVARILEAADRRTKSK